MSKIGNRMTSLETKGRSGTGKVHRIIYGEERAQRKPLLMPMGPTRSERMIWSSRLSW